MMDSGLMDGDTPLEAGNIFKQQMKSATIDVMRSLGILLKGRPCVQARTYS